MKNYQYKHKVKLNRKQPDLLWYVSQLLLGVLPVICCYLIEMILTNLQSVGIAINLPDIFIPLFWAVLFFNTIRIWFISPISFSKTQRMKNSLRKVIETNKLFYENNEFKKITLSLEINFYWIDDKLYLEVYPRGGQFTHKMNELTIIFQTALNMTVLSVQDDYADHTTYILTKGNTVAINAIDYLN